MTLTIIPDVVRDQAIRALAGSDSAHAAAALMVEADISAVLINDDAGRLIGIVTERDLARRIVAAGRDPETTTLAEIMTPEPECVPPDDTPDHALVLMQARRYRHLPITVEGRAVGVVSMRDLRTATRIARRRGGVLSWFTGGRAAG